MFDMQMYNKTNDFLKHWKKKKKKKMKIEKQKIEAKKIKMEKNRKFLVLRLKSKERSIRECSLWNQSHWK